MDGFRWRTYSVLLCPFRLKQMGRDGDLVIDQKFLIVLCQARKFYDCLSEWDGAPAVARGNARTCKISVLRFGDVWAGAWQDWFHSLCRNLRVMEGKGMGNGFERS